MQRSLVREWLVMALVLAIGLAAAAGRWFGRFDQAFYDMVMAVWRRAPSAEIVIVAIDDPSSAAIGRWPWPRQIHATVIDRIAQAGPAVLAVDMILAEPDLENPRADQLLAMALAQLPVVLPIYIEATGTASAGATMREVSPIKRFADAARALGHIDGEIDLDGIARRVYLRQGIGVAKHWQLAAAAVEIAKPGTLNETIGARHLAAPLSAASVVRDQRFIIPFTGPPGQIERISYAALLRGEVPAERLRGRIVFLGATATGLGDAYPTPVSGESVAMPGIEINANVADALLRGIDIREASPLLQTIVAPLAVLALLAGYLVLSPRRALIASVALALIALIAALALLRLGSFWFSPVLVIIAALVAYPLWSWRRLEAANRHLAQEMRQIAEESSWYGAALIPKVRSTSLVQDAFAMQLDAASAAAESLRLSQRVFAQSFAGLPIAAAVCDRREQVLVTNALADQLLGRGGALSVRMGIAGAIPADEWAATLEATFRGGNTATRELSIGARQYLVNVAPYAFVDDVVVGAIVTLADVTPIKQLERERDETLQFLSHDLRSPQNSILAVTQLAQDEPETMPLKRLLPLVQNYAERTLDLIGALIVLSRAERLSDAAVSAIDWAEVVRQSVEEAEPQGMARNQAIVLTLPAEQAIVRGVSELLSRAVMNLVSNALKYRPAGTPIEISLVRRDAHWDLTVSDRGPGIPPEAVPRLFTKFYRVLRPNNPDGIGLGPAFVKTVATRLGGAIVAHARDGGGSAFVLTLPAVDE